MAVPSTFTDRDGIWGKDVETNAASANQWVVELDWIVFHSDDVDFNHLIPFALTLWFNWWVERLHVSLDDCQQKLEH